MQELQNILTNAFITVLTAAVPVIVTYFVNWINTKIANEKTELNAKYLNLAADAIATATLETTQVYVGGLKGQNLFDKDAQTKALQMSLDRAKEIMGEKTRVALEEIVGDINIYITSQIEALIAQQKVVAK